MFNNISLGIYLPGKTLIHRLQARTKLLALFWLVIFLVLANQRKFHYIPYLMVLILTVTAIVIAGIPPRYLWHRLRILFIFAAIVAVPTLFFTAGSPLYSFGPFWLSYPFLQQLINVFDFSLVAYIVILLLIPTILTKLNLWKEKRRRTRIKVRLLILFIFLDALLIGWSSSIKSSATSVLVGPLAITDEAVWVEVIIFCNFLMLYALSLLLTMTTRPVALIEGLTMLLKPLRRLKLPVDDFALMTLIALRFVPTLTEEAEQLIKAQTARGADFSHGKMRERVRNLVTLIVPLLQGALRRAADLGTALEARGYNAGGRQTLLHEKRFARLDYGVLAVVALITIGSLFF